MVTPCLIIIPENGRYTVLQRVRSIRSGRIQRRDLGSILVNLLAEGAITIFLTLPEAVLQVP